MSAISTNGIIKGKLRNFSKAFITEFAFQVAERIS